MNKIFVIQKQFFSRICSMQTITFYKAFSQKRRQVLPQYSMWELFLLHPVLGERGLYSLVWPEGSLGPYVVGQILNLQVPLTPKLALSL